MSHLDCDSDARNRSGTAGVSILAYNRFDCSDTKLTRQRPHSRELRMKHDIIVVGASAGGVGALQELTRGLPPNLSAAIFVVLHIPPLQGSNLPAILNFSGPLRAMHPSANQRIEPGQIYVAPPDQHLIIANSHVSLWRGPKENHHRPAINALFRSAAAEYKQRVVGVLLSGTLDDGSAGLWWVKRYGGLAIVQDPSTAIFSEMPANALQYISADYLMAPAQIGPLLGELANGTVKTKTPVPGEEPGLDLNPWKRNN